MYSINYTSMSKPTNLKNLIESKPMKITLDTVLKSFDGLEKISKLKLPVAVSFKVGKIIKALNAELEVYNETRKKRIQELGEVTKDHEGKPTKNYQVTEANLLVWEKEHKELVEREVEINIHPLKLSDLGDEKLEPTVFAELDWLITE